jgi:cardiolipin synthase
LESFLFFSISCIAIAFMTLMLVLALFEPGLPYRVRTSPGVASDAPGFSRILGPLAGSHVHRDARIEVLTNGEAFYAAELRAIAEARHSVHLEAYMFEKGEVARRFIAVLSARARAGVRVRVVVDAIGNLGTWRSYFRELIDAGGGVHYYHPFHWYTLPRLNNRTHRELVVIDGRVGFIGGAGIADHWQSGRKGHRRWRDTMFRVTGPIVNDLQSTFAENWLETSGEVLCSPEDFPECGPAGESMAMIVASSPTTGRSTRGRMLYQSLIAAAQRTIHISSPYFLPDRSARNEMIRAIKERGVRLQILTPGQHSDHLLTRRASRRLYGPLLRAGADIFEYQPSMMHAKVMIVDGIWSVVGSTNFDHRSFGLNDEVNLAACDEGLARQLHADFQRDLAESRPVTYRDWCARPLFERGHECLGWLLERQQ